MNAPAGKFLVEDTWRGRVFGSEWRNAAGILTTACPDEWAEIIEVLRGFKLLRSEVEAAGKNRSPISRQIDGAFYSRGWIEKDFATAIGEPSKSKWANSRAPITITKDVSNQQDLE